MKFNKTTDPDLVSTEEATIKYSSLSGSLRKLFNISTNKKKITSILLLAVLLLGVPASLYAFKYVSDWRSRASTNGVDLAVVPSVKQLAEGETATWDIFINTQQHAITTLQLEVLFDNNLFDFVSLKPSNTLDEIIVNGLASGGKANMTLGIKPVITNPGPPATYAITPFMGTGILAKLTLKAKTGVTSGQADISIVADRGDGTGTISLTKENGSTNVIGDLTNGRVTIGSLASPASSPVAMGWTRVDERASSVEHSGNWYTENQSGAFLDTQRWTLISGEYATFTFTGTGVRYITKYAYNHGAADIYLDGVLDKTIDLYAATTSWQNIAYEKTGLANTQHTLKIVNKATTDRAAIVTDAFEYLSGNVTASPIPSPLPTVNPAVTPSPASSPLASPVPSPTAAPSVDVVTIRSAKVTGTILRKALIEIEVVATSTEQPNVTLTLLNYGDMKYSPKISAYTKTILVKNPIPTSITVISSKGGRMDSIVDTTYLK